MKNIWVVYLCWLVLGCSQTKTPIPRAASDVEPPVRAQADKTVPADATSVQIDAQALPPKIKPAQAQVVKPSKKMACGDERARVEARYQNALEHPKHRACTQNNDCLLLPSRTLCSDALCIYESGPVNRTHAKALKAIQYEADLKTCIELTQACNPTVHKSRGRRCGTRRFESVCEAGLCVAQTVKRAPKPKTAQKTQTKPKTPKASKASKASKTKPQRKATARYQSPGAQLILGATNTADRRYKMDITQSLMFARNAAFDACLAYPGSKNGSITFEFSVTPRGTLSQLRQRRSSLPKRMGLCLKTWLKSLEYPAPKSQTVTVTQVIRYIAP